MGRSALWLAGMVVLAVLVQPLPARSQIPGTGAAAPLSLTASDGTGLQIVSFQARAAVEDPLAFTELHVIEHDGRGNLRFEDRPFVLMDQRRSASLGTVRGTLAPAVTVAR